MITTEVKEDNEDPKFWERKYHEQWNQRERLAKMVIAYCESLNGSSQERINKLYNEMYDEALPF